VVVIVIVAIAIRGIPTIVATNREVGKIDVVVAIRVRGIRIGRIRIRGMIAGIRGIQIRGIVEIVAGAVIVIVTVIVMVIVIVMETVIVIVTVAVIVIVTEIVIVIVVVAVIVIAAAMIAIHGIPMLAATNREVGKIDVVVAIQMVVAGIASFIGTDPKAIAMVVWGHAKEKNKFGLERE